jgi:hypothetical protein
VKGVNFNCVVSRGEMASVTRILCEGSLVNLTSTRIDVVAESLEDKWKTSLVNISIRVHSWAVLRSAVSQLFLFVE